VYKTALIMTPFFLLDLIFVSATSLKIPDGGWVTIAIGGVIFVLLMTWKRGRELMFENLQRDALPLDIFINHLGNSVQIVQGQAIFMTSTPKIVPHAMLHNLKHNKILHELNFLITVETKDVPYVEDDARIYVKKLDERFIKVIVYYGFKDEPDIPKALKQVYDALELEFNMMQISFFISRDRVISTVGDGMAPWREKLFISMQRNTSAVSDFYQIPSNRVVELGSQIEI
jgi:KUP system potassium uptake protein